jgi:hypothetical protein
MIQEISLPDGCGAVATNLKHMFYSCSSLTKLSLPSGFGQNATNLRNFTYCCSSLNNLTLPDGFGSVATDVAFLVQNCISLISLHLPDGFGKNATDTTRAFMNARNLTTVTGNPNFKVSLTLSDCVKLTHDSLMVFINGLQVVETKQILTLGTTLLAKLSDDEKKIATDKGWTLA